MNARGEVIDGLGKLTFEEMQPIEAPIPGIIERSPVNESLETGVLAVDALVPVGKGQRELIIGNRSTGKTALALDTIIHQKDKNVYCIYVSIGQRQANVARIAQLLQEQGALEYTIIVSADASEPAINRYLAPYVVCTIGEYFRNRKLDALIVYDDLSNHAIAYREMSLLMRRSPGREAYPGDVFYLHSRLLERAGKLAEGGTLTALPIVQVQADDITAYIPTNLISITDGQIFLDTRLFNSGIRPAVNVELSVSRVGGAAQTKAIKQMTRALRLELAQYHELVAFAQFGTELDIISQKKLERGAVIVNLLKQKPLETYSFVDQTLMFFLLKENYLDRVPLAQVHEVAVRFASYVRLVYPDVYNAVKIAQEVSAESFKDLQAITLEFAKIFGFAQPQ
jgi:F-type H+-transporting ATPase subunit alpha